MTIGGGELVIPKRCQIDPDTGLFFCTPAIYDHGTVSITVNGVSKGVGYGQGSTSSTVATALANAINADSSYPVSASVSSTTVNLTSRVANASTNYTLSASAQSTDTADFGGATGFSTTPSGANLTGAMDPSGPAAPSLNSPITSTYTYDPLDNLTLVSQEQGWPQGGQPLPAQTRTYAYDSLSRVTSATTPESGTVTYTYTSFSQVATRTDARGVVSTYSYDGLNRSIGVTYSDGTPAATYTYDAGGAAANALGRLTSLADGGGSESYTYDVLGRITNASKVISGTTYNVGYGYNNAGQLSSLTYPSGRVVSQNYDAIGWMNSISSGATNYLSNPSYNAAGQPLGFTYGNGVNASFSYNDHLQLATLRYSNSAQDLLNLAYDYTTPTVTGNNGQIQSITDNLDATRSTSYVYDPWARLKQATAGNPSTPTWSLSYDYDRFGNRRNQNVIGGTGPAVSLTIDPNTNRIQDAGYAYDSAGNLTNDTFHSYAYDAENRTKTVDSTGATYTYSGPLRVKKVVGATTTVYVFSGSKVIAEYANGSLSKEYVYAGGQLLATLNPDGSVASYEHPDHLSIRAETDAAGNLTRSFGHYPFGESWYETGTTSKWQFTSYERDSESGLDQAVFRYDSSRLGRFMSPDPLGGSIFDPQSLDRYSYVRNDPVNGADPLGLSDHVKQNATGSWDWWAGGGGRCALGGTPIPCSTWSSIVGMGGGGTATAYLCSAGADCSSFRLDPVTGQLQYLTGTSTSYWGPCQNATYETETGPVECLGQDFVTWHFTWQTVSGVLFTQTGPTTWTFVSSYPFSDTVTNFERAGFVEHRLDHLDFNHPGKLDLRDKGLFCSAHVGVDKSSGQNGQATTGDVHLDTVNPWAIPWPLDTIPFAAHAFLDQLNVYPGSSACQ